MERPSVGSSVKWVPATLRDSYQGCCRVVRLIPTSDITPKKWRLKRKKQMENELETGLKGMYTVQGLGFLRFTLRDSGVPRG